MTNEKPLLTWQDLGGLFGGWGFFFGVITALEFPIEWALVTAVLPVIGVIVLAQFRLWQRTPYKFITRLGSQGAGDELLDCVDNAKNYIFLSHFRNEGPSKAYEDALTRAKHRGVTIHRLVGWAKEELAHTDTIAWINKHIERGLAEHRFFAMGDTRLCWEMYVFDGIAAAIALPAMDPLSEGKLPNVLVSSDKDLVKSLESLYTNYWSRGER